MQVSIGGGAAAGDRYLVQPVAHGAQAIALAISDPGQVAAAAPVHGTPALANLGSGQLAQPQVSDVSNAALLDSVELVFNDPPGSFDLVDIGSGVTLAAGVAYSAGAAISVNGWSTAITGAPAAGDRFRVQANIGGIADNRNALALAELQGGAAIEGRLSYAQAYSTLVARAGTSARSAQFNAQAREQLLADAVAARESISGVNLDEEAIDLTRYQQAYQAMTRVVETSNTLFDAILAAVR
jgi:flagellar hook-associated protein 1 FlgK